MADLLDQYVIAITDKNGIHCGKCVSISVDQTIVQLEDSRRLHWMSSHHDFEHVATNGQPDGDHKFSPATALSQLTAVKQILLCSTTSETKLRAATDWITAKG